MLAQLLGDRQHEVGCRGSRGQFARELEADDTRDEHADRLAKHRRLGLDAAHTPAEDSETVDHGGVRVGAYTGIGIGLAVAHHDYPSEVLNVDLVHDAGPRRDDAELIERALAPTQELVALAVALVLQRHVELQSLRGAEVVGDDAVVDDQFSRGQRVDAIGVATHLGHGLTHGGQVHDTRDAGEVLHDDAGGGELDLLAGFGRRIPGRQRADLLGGDVRAVLSAQQVLQQHPVGVRQTELAQRIEAEDLERLLPHLQLGLGTETVQAGHTHLPSEDLLRPSLVARRPAGRRA